MPKRKEGYYITKQAKLRFKKWLVEQNLTINKFAPLCGCSRQYIEQILAGQKKITDRVRYTFQVGGYPYL